MNNVFVFDGYSDFCDWCDQHGYDSDDFYDESEESSKRDTYLTFYVKNTRYAEPTYAEVCVLVSYDHGWQEGEVLREGLKRTVKQVVVEQVEYE